MDTIHVLLIEDNPGDADIIMELLDESGLTAHFSVAHVTCMREAVRTLDNTKEAFHIILLDLGLPDSKGLEALEEIQKRAADTYLYL